MGLKYELTNDTLILGNTTLRRIRLLKDIKPFNKLESGSLGGYIEKIENLSQFGNSWVFYDAIVCENGYVGDNACVNGYSMIKGNAKVVNNAYVGDGSVISGNAKLVDDCQVFKCLVGGNSKIINHINGMNKKIYDFTVYGINMTICSPWVIFNDINQYVVLGGYYKNFNDINSITSKLGISGHTLTRIIDYAEEIAHKDN